VNSWELDHPVFTSFDFATIFFYGTKSSVLLSTPNLEDQVPVFMSPSDRVARLYPQAPGSLFIAFYDSQDYSGGDGGIVTRLHTGRLYIIPLRNVYKMLKLN
jgi:hypothetical protein